MMGGEASEKEKSEKISEIAAEPGAISQLRRMRISDSSALGEVSWLRNNPENSKAAPLLPSQQKAAQGVHDLR